LISRAARSLGSGVSLPSEEEISEALRWVGFDDVKLDADEQSICFDKRGLEINLNSIGKGYALDRAAAFLDERGLTDYLWHGGSSSVLARGRNQADPQRASRSPEARTPSGRVSFARSSVGHRGRRDAVF